jgi:hypothetical protein
MPPGSWAAAGSQQLSCSDRCSLVSVLVVVICSAVGRPGPGDMRPVVGSAVVQDWTGSSTRRDQSVNHQPSFEASVPFLSQIILQAESGVSGVACRRASQGK